MTALETDPVEMSGPGRIPRPGVVERLTQILDVFATGPDRLLLEDITTITGLPRSTAFRILGQLVNLHWLEHDAHGYRLGVRVHGIGSRANDYSAVRAAASSFLNSLHLATGAVAHLSVLEGSKVHYLDKIGGAASASIPSRVGARLPAETTVSGRALLASLSPERVDSLMSLDDEGTHRIDLSRLHAQLNQIRQRHGLAYVLSENRTSNISAVSAPVLGPAGTVAAISVATRSSVRLDNIAPMVASAARRTSEAMFPNWRPRQSKSHQLRSRATTRIDQ